MPRKKTTPVVDPRDVEIAALRAQLAQVAINATSHVSRLSQAATLGSHAAYVGIRNVSDNTIGIKGKYGEEDINLHADLGQHDPSSVTAMSYAWWLVFRRDKLIQDGQVIRDDAILGKAFTAGPDDLADELPPGYLHNVIIDPEQWIRSRDETQLRNDMAKITSESSLRRIRRGVDLVLKRLQNGDNSDESVRRSWMEVPSKFRLVDEITTHRLERPEDFVRGN